MNARWRRDERLRLRKRFDAVFKTGRSFGAGPIRVFWRFFPSSLPRPAIAVGFVVPKKKIPKAVRRNLLKRRMRECFRLLKSLLYKQWPESLGADIVFLYRDHQTADFSTIHSSVSKAIEKLKRAAAAFSPPPIFPENTR
jgi:ribonuclease P protein component